MKKITLATPLPDYVVRLEYASGEVFDVDFKPVIARGGVFAKIEPLETFKQVRVGVHGRFIEWPGGIDFCADALYERAIAQV